MNNEHEINELINQVDEEHLKAVAMQEDGDNETATVIPFRLIKITDQNLTDIDQEGSTSLNIESSEPLQTLVQGKYSKYYRQSYRNAWEHERDFKGWLRGVKGQPTRAYCTYCQKTLHAHRLSLLKHTCTIRHQKAAQIFENPIPPMEELTGSIVVSNVQSVVVTEDPLLTSEDSNPSMLQPQIIYSQEEAEDDENAMSQDMEDYSEEEEPRQVPPMNKKEVEMIAPPISTNVIDTTRGAPVMGLSVSLYKLVEGRWTYINEGLTDNKGRFSGFFKSTNFTGGRYKLHYDVDRYFESKQQKSIFPFIETVFDTETLNKVHFPLMIGPNTYTTYRSTCE